MSHETDKDLKKKAKDELKDDQLDKVSGGAEATDQSRLYADRNLKMKKT
ncbi:MAG: hypothetical protein JO113_08835 [Candidatus Eremiobacteraeota bacterium]|nr:hypothetical protein [Candidatus Eremiobacteraeota bacterium]